MNSINKSSYEEFPVEFNFIRELKLIGETITGKTVTCVSLETGLSTKTTIVDSEAIASPKIELVIKAGDVGTTHKITVIATTSGGNAYTKDLFVYICNETDKVFYKRPNSEFLITTDFSDKLVDGDSVDTDTTTAILLSTGADATSDVIEASVVEDNIVYVGVKGGSNSYDYRITVKVETTLGYKYQEDIIMGVSNESQV